MEFLVTSNIETIEEYWKALCQNDDIRFYQTYLFAKTCVDYRKSSLSAIKNKNTKCSFVVEFENQKAVCIAPLNIDKTPTKIVRLLGHGTNAGYLDFIYNDGKYVRPMLEYCRKLFDNYQFEFTFVPEYSPLVELMCISKEFSNYRICMGEYDEYFSSLSKNTRQNIRTSYNRLKKDEREIELQILKKADECFEKKLKECNRIYEKRKLYWKKQGKVDNKFRQWIFLKRDVIYKTCRESDSGIIVLLNIDKTCSAFFVGFTFNNGIYIPRLAINMEYSRYSPGIVLVNEYLKTIQTNFNEDYIFDLCRGDESYKSKLGGIKTTTYTLVLK